MAGPAVKGDRSTSRRFRVTSSSSVIMFRSVQQRTTSQWSAPATRGLAIGAAAALAFALGYLLPQALPLSETAAEETIQSAGTETRAARHVASQRVLEDDFTSAIKTEKFWNTTAKGQKSKSNANGGYDQTGRSGLTTAPFWSPFGPVPDSLTETHSQSQHDNAVARKTYRTVCVRMCDGFYFPISYATTTDRFDEDETKCRSTCGTSARLYFYPNDGGEPEDMRDRSGRRYMNLETAFLYRTKYDAACTCQPQPWSDKAKARHELYALYEAKAAGSQTASADIKKLFAAHPELRATTLAADAEKLAETGGMAGVEKLRDRPAVLRYAERHDAANPVTPEPGNVAGSAVITDFAAPIQPVTPRQPSNTKRAEKKKSKQRANRASKPTAQDVFRSNLMGSSGF